jgi:hypothetical protein
MIDYLRTTNLRFFAWKNAPENEIKSRQASGQSLASGSRRISVERLVSRFRKFGYLIDF